MVRRSKETGTEIDRERFVCFLGVLDRERERAVFTVLGQRAI